MKKKIVNPFICQGYESPEFFCGREEETKTVMSTLYNGRNITLISPTNQKYTLDTTSKSAVTKDKLAAGDYYIIVAYNGTYYTQNCLGVYVDFKWK